MPSQVTARSAAKKRVEQFEEDGVEDYLYIMALADDEAFQTLCVILDELETVYGDDAYGEVTTRRDNAMTETQAALEKRAEQIKQTL